MAYTNGNYGIFSIAMHFVEQGVSMYILLDKKKIKNVIRKSWNARFWEGEVVLRGG